MPSLVDGVEKLFERVQVELTSEDPKPDQALLDDIAERPAKKRQGLSKFMWYRNGLLKAAKARSGGAPLSAGEVKDVEELAKKRWADMPEHIKDVHGELYDDWQSSHLDDATSNDPVLYLAPWGGGCKCGPVSPSELCAYYRECGWAPEAEIFKQNAFHVDDQCDVDWSLSAGIACHGCDRSAAGVCKKQIEDLPGFGIIHHSLTIYLEFVARDVAESGELAIVLEGCLLGSDAPQLEREVCFVSGTSWNPKVFDIANCRFAEDVDRSAVDLTLPCDFVLLRRQCRVSDRFQVLDISTSGEWCFVCARSTGHWHCTK